MDMLHEVDIMITLITARPFYNVLINKDFQDKVEQHVYQGSSGLDIIDGCDDFNALRMWMTVWITTLTLHGMSCSNIYTSICFLMFSISDLLLNQTYQSIRSID